MRSLWVKKIGELAPDGAVASVTISTDEGPVLLRGEWSTVFEAAGVLRRGIKRGQNVAEIVPIRKKRAPDKH